LCYRLKENQYLEVHLRPEPIRFVHHILETPQKNCIMWKYYGDLLINLWSLGYNHYLISLKSMKDSTNKPVYSNTNLQLGKDSKGHLLEIIDFAVSQDRYWIALALKKMLISEDQQCRFLVI
jgi:hypothetical protein